MKKGKKIFITILLFIIIAIAVVLFLYLNKDNQLINSIFNHQEELEEEQTINDNYNGVYKYQEQLDQTYYIFSGCSISTLDQYIIVVNSNYYIYDSTCMGTFLNESGDTENLNIKEDYNTNKYYIEYNGYTYTSDSTSQEFTNINNAAKKISINFNLNSFNVLMKNTQRTGANYSIKTTIANLDNGYRFSAEPVIDGFFNISFKNNNKTLYQKSGVSLDNLPKLNTYTTSSIIVLEKDKTLNKYSNRLLIVSDDGVIYNSDLLLPITIQNVELTTDNSIFIKYDSKLGKYRVLIGYDKQFCRLDDESDDIVNYEFTISYDHSNRSFTKLEFVQIGLAKDGCDHVNEILEESKW